MFEISRRRFIAGAAATVSVGVAGCQSSPPPGPVAEATVSTYPSDFATMYGPVYGEPFPVPAIEPSNVDPAFMRKLVPYPTSEPAGTIVIDPAAHYLYSVRENGMAVRYGVGVGRQGFSWSGDATIEAKREWPDWYPPKEMIDRQPELDPILTDLQSGRGVPGGPKNPLGARAMYLYQNGKDTLYRIHGTFEPWTIGKSVSSGCIRMINQDVIDLYNRTPIGTRVVVLGTAGAGVA
jgi:lipoprotein-anchoring transpeptidase ErfK/SrfK